MDMFSHVLGTVDAAMLTAGTSKAEQERGEAPFQKALHMSIGQTADGFKERENLAIILQEFYDGLVETGHLLVLLIASRIMGCPAVEHITAAIAALVHRDAFLVGEAVDAHYQTAALDY